MKRAVVVMSFVSLTFKVHAQNLVPNGGFEQYLSCPLAGGLIDSCLYWINPALPSAVSPDYYNSCAPPGTGYSVPAHISGYQQAHNGSAYAGIIPFYYSYTYREYIETPLLAPLVPNACYHFEMFVNVKNSSPFASDQLGVYFSNSLVSGITNQLPLPFSPQIIHSGYITDTAAWTKIEANYFASGGESYMIIGNFNDDANTGYLLLGSSLNGPSYYYIDDVSLSICTGDDNIIANAFLNIHSNPASSSISLLHQGIQKGTAELYDPFGRLVIQQDLQPKETTISTIGLPTGVYIVRVSTADGQYAKKVVINR